MVFVNVYVVYMNIIYINNQIDIVLMQVYGNL